MSPNPSPSADSHYEPVAALVDELVRAGVAHACVSPGARSTPLALAVARHPDLRAWSHIDERSAAFFALGLAKTTRRPVALVCTSGTAAANFFPAIVEAAYAHVPLVVLTADRPPELRGCSAPQTIDQIKLYGTHVKWFAEAGLPATGSPATGLPETGSRYFRALAARAAAFATSDPPGPVHVNLPFREPLLPAPDVAAGACGTRVHHAVPAPDAAAVAALVDALAGSPRALLVCGPCDADPAAAAAIAALARRAGCPLLADPLSQMRSGAHDTAHVVAYYDALLRDERFAARLRAEVVVRIGAMPRSKPLREYLARHADARQIVISPLAAWSDPLLSAAVMIAADPGRTCAAAAAALPPAAGNAWTAAWLDADRRAGAALAAGLAGTAELFEGKVFAELAALIPEDAVVYAGNSMPVRDLESFWPAGSKRVRFLCNHGASGIDGFVSSGLGAAAGGDRPVVMVTGDLGFYHDLNGLLAAKRYGLRATIIVLNNDGGGIFSFLPQAECGAGFEEFFLTPHGLDFRGAVEMYGAAFTRVASWEQFRAAVPAAVAAPRTAVIEVPAVAPDRNVALHRALWAAVADAVREP